MFVTFEGPEGAGKTSVLSEIKKKLEGVNAAFILTREPGGIAIAEQIRNIILDPNHTEMDIRTEALLFAAARAQHFYEKVKPALDEGKLVICDRFIDSSLVYQGLARGLGINEVREINKFAIGTRMPDKTFLLDVDSSIGLSRINANRQDEINRIDQESLSFHRNVRNGYLELSEMERNRFVVIDASRSLEEVVEDVWEKLKGMSQQIK